MITLYFKTILNRHPDCSTLDEHYKNVAEFSYPSRAAIAVRADMFTMVGGVSEASAATRVRPRERRAPPRDAIQ